MSWSINVPFTPIKDFIAVLDAAELNLSSVEPDLAAQWKTQLETAKRGAETMFHDLIADGGHTSGSVNAYLGGHANHDGAGDAAHFTKQEFISASVNWKPDEI